MSIATFFDVAIIGGGFSGTMVAANIVRSAKKPLSIALISEDAENVFGPAYSTPRPEHLLNVQASNMGAYADDAEHFYNWLRKQNIAARPEDFMPRMIYGRYLSSIWTETKTLAAQKNIFLEHVVARVEDVGQTPNDYALVLASGHALTARNIVLATGNTLKQHESGHAPAGLIRQPWQFDFSTLLPMHKNIAIIGSGLTAADTIISLLNAGWPQTPDARMTVYSKSGLMPRAHLEHYDAQKVLPYRLSDFKNMRLSSILHRLRCDIRERNIPWHYAIDALRPFTQDIWAQLFPTDKARLRGKYFTLWNVHRHRYAPHIGQRIDAEIVAGRIKFVRARVSSVTPVPNGGVTLSFAHRPSVQADMAFECMGVEYRILDMPLYKNMAAKGLVAPSPQSGIAVDGNFITHRGNGHAVYVLGTPLIGQLFETTAVPELRGQAAAIAHHLLAQRQ